MFAMKNDQLIDRFNRHLNYLRLSITDRCNLRCLYCTPDGRIPKLSHTSILSYEEIMRIVRVGIDLGINKIRITGGEPLVRKNALPFLMELGRLKVLQDISLTTNGVLLADQIESIAAAGIKRINISLDTLNRDKYQHITGYDHFDKVWKGIKMAQDLGFRPLKINVVALKGINEDEIVDFGRLSVTHPFHIRFIEYMPMGIARMRNDEQLLTPAIKERLALLGELLPVEKDRHDGPAERFRFKGAKGEIGFISSVSHHFCKRCNRLRLTASGQLRACLLSDRQEDLRGPLRNGASDKEIAQIFLETVRHKNSTHGLGHHLKSSQRIKGQMIGIGG
jgi:cyclic pyranopterin phosphate synthase